MCSCLQATMVVADAKESLTITGNGDVVEPHDGIVGELCWGPLMQRPCSDLYFGHALS
jgi:hypothetical protein